MPKNELKTRVFADPAEAKHFVDLEQANAVDDGRGCWTLGVDYGELDSTEILVVTLPCNTDPLSQINGAMRIWKHLWMMRFGIEKLMSAVAKEAYLDEETVKALIPDNDDLEPLCGVAPWEVLDPEE